MNRTSVGWGGWLWGCAIALAACSGGGTGSRGGGECSSNSDCGSGLVCLQGTCIALCNTSRDCQPWEACDGEACDAVDNPFCRNHAECTSPGPCEISEAAECVAGDCVYRPRAVGASCATTTGATGTCDGTTCVPSCDDATDCTSPNSCQETAGATCTNGTCVYQSKPEATRCQRPDDTARALNGFCVAGECRDCIREQDCPPPATSFPECLDVRCVSYTCVALDNAGDACGSTGCAAGVQTEVGSCTSTGSCSQTAVPCDPFACNPGGTACLSTCTNDSDCTAGRFCNTDLSTPTCAPRLDDGDACSGFSTSGLAARACLSGWCSNGFCCESGDCCMGPGDCPAAYSAPASCLETGAMTTCQGVRVEATCTESICGSVEIPDDTACATGLARDCGAYADVRCTGGGDQAVASCAGSCDGSEDCATGYTCASSSCTAIQGQGETCPVGNECGGGLKCDAGICCDTNAANCCQTNADCPNELRCDTSLSQCVESCTPHADGDCKNPDTHVCNGSGDACITTLATGAACQTDADCTHPELPGTRDGFCVDNVCCDSPCDGACQTCGGGSCSSLDGVVKAGTCDNDGNGCGDGYRCICSQGTCKRRSGESCTDVGQCEFPYCECGDTSCSINKCTNESCSECWFTGGVGCSGPMGSTALCDLVGTDDGACDGSGSCKALSGTDCTGQPDSFCATGDCECASADCATGVCADEACLACEFAEDGGGSGWLCTGVRGYNTPCGAGQICDRDTGSCLKANGQDCSANSECGSGNCECANGTCSTKKCNNIDCGGCRFDTTNFDDTVCSSTMIDGSQGDCSGDLLCAGGVCSDPGTCSCICRIEYLCDPLPPPPSRAPPCPDYDCIRRGIGCNSGFFPSCSGSCTDTGTGCSGSGLSCECVGF